MQTNPVTATKVVLETIIKRSPDQICEASYNELAKQSGYSRSSVIIAINLLSIAGVILKEHSINPDGGKGRNRYKILKRNMDCSIF